MKMSKRDMILLAVIGAVAVLGGFWWFVVKPANADLSAQRDELAALESESSDLRDTLSRFSVSTRSETVRTAERLRLAKALPENTEAAGVVVQLQRLADRANVELTSIKTNSFSDYGSIRGTDFEVRITGRFFDVDDFLYRLHRQVALDEKDRPIVGGRLFATTSVDLNLVASDGGTGTSGRDNVVGTIRVVAFSSVPGGAAASPAASAAAISAPAATPAAVSTPAAASAPTDPAAGPPQATATPTGGTP